MQVVRFVWELGTHHCWRLLSKCLRGVAAHNAHVICTVMYGSGVANLARVCRETSVDV